MRVEGRWPRGGPRQRPSLSACRALYCATPQAPSRAGWHAGPEFPNPRWGLAYGYGSTGGQKAGLLELGHSLGHSPRSPRVMVSNLTSAVSAGGTAASSRAVAPWLQRAVAKEGWPRHRPGQAECLLLPDYGKVHGDLQGGVDPRGHAGQRTWTRLPCLPPGPSQWLLVGISGTAGHSAVY